jgi:transcriptional regulator with PAS, ATPase and Fis domain
VPLRVKSLKESAELIDEISDYFLTIINQRRPRPLALSDACRARLRNYAFPGNIRELFNVLQQLSVVADDRAEDHHLPATFRQPLRLQSSAACDRPCDLKEQVRAYEREIIERAIATHGSKRKAAEALGVDIGTIVRKTQTSN